MTGIPRKTRSYSLVSLIKSPDGTVVITAGIYVKRQRTSLGEPVP